jgi:hypothetical protein
LKKAAPDYHKKIQIDENIFTDCRIIADVYRTTDVTSTIVQGKLMKYEKKKYYKLFCPIFPKGTYK